jgi:hypothetical protein
MYAATVCLCLDKIIPNRAIYKAGSTHACYVITRNNDKTISSLLCRNSSLLGHNNPYTHAECFAETFTFAQTVEFRKCYPKQPFKMSDDDVTEIAAAYLCLSGGFLLLNAERRKKRKESRCWSLSVHNSREL